MKSKEVHLKKRLLFLLTFILAMAPLLARAETATLSVDHGITSWMLTSTALVLLMVPGLAMFYGGLVRTKNVVGTMMHSLASMGLIGVLWVVCGYSLCFGPNVLGGLVGWKRDFLFLKGLDDSIIPPGIPEYVFAMFQGKFAIITPALIAGAFAERVRFKAYCVFIGLWSLLVYSPLCHWVWASDGFLFNMGAMGAIDFAGGTVVHISAGISALICALFLGVRRGYPKTAMHPNNLVMTLIGAGLLWVGWFGFNAGSSISSGLVTARALTMTQVAAAAGALAWMILEGLTHGKVTSLGLVSGILAGLVVITPAAGVVRADGAILLAVMATIVCYGAISLKSKIGYDDSLDVFGIHGIAGMIGAVMLTFFIRPSWWVEASSKINGSWTWPQQLLVQLKAVGLTVVFSAVVTMIILWAVEKAIGFRLEVEDEMAGMDHSLHGEQGYGLINPN